MVHGYYDVIRQAARTVPGAPFAPTIDPSGASEGEECLVSSDIIQGCAWSRAHHVFTAEAAMRFQTGVQAIIGADVSTLQKSSTWKSWVSARDRSLEACLSAAQQVLQSVGSATPTTISTPVGAVAATADALRGEAIRLGSSWVVSKRYPILVHVWKNPVCARTFANGWGRIWQLLFEHHISCLHAPFSATYNIGGTFVTSILLPPIHAAPFAPSEALCPVIYQSIQRLLGCLHGGVSTTDLSGRVGLEAVHPEALLVYPAADGLLYLMNLAQFELPICIFSALFAGSSLLTLRVPLLLSYVRSRTREQGAASDVAPSALETHVTGVVFPLVATSLLAATQRKGMEDASEGAHELDGDCCDGAAGSSGSPLRDQSSLLRSAFHSHGLNMRLLYHFAGYAAESPASLALLRLIKTEMVGRVLKHLAWMEIALGESVNGTRGRKPPSNAAAEYSSRVPTPLVNTAGKMDVLNRLAMLCVSANNEFLELHVLPVLRTKFSAPPTYTIRWGDVDLGAALKPMCRFYGAAISLESGRIEEVTLIAASRVSHMLCPHVYEEMLRRNESGAERGVKDLWARADTFVDCSRTMHEEMLIRAMKAAVVTNQCRDLWRRVQAAPYSVGDEASVPTSCLSPAAMLVLSGFVGEGLLPTLETQVVWDCHEKIMSQHRMAALDKWKESLQCSGDVGGDAALTTCGDKNAIVAELLVCSRRLLELAMLNDVAKHKAPQKDTFSAIAGCVAPPWVDLPYMVEFSLVIPWVLSLIHRNALPPDTVRVCIKDPMRMMFQRLIRCGRKRSAAWLLLQLTSTIAAFGSVPVQRLVVVRQCALLSYKFHRLVYGPGNPTVSNCRYVLYLLLLVARPRVPRVLFSNLSKIQKASMNWTGKQLDEFSMQYGVVRTIRATHKFLWPNSTAGCGTMLKEDMEAVERRWAVQTLQRMGRGFILRRQAPARWVPTTDSDAHSRFIIGAVSKLTKKATAGKGKLNGRSDSQQPKPRVGSLRPQPSEEPKKAKFQPESAMPRSGEPQQATTQPKLAKPEELQQPASHPESLKPEGPQHAAPQAETAKPQPESGKPEEPQPRSAKPEGPQQAEPQSESAKPEEPQHAAPQAETAKPQQTEPQQAEPQPESAKPEEPQQAEPHPESAKPEEPKQAEPQRDQQEPVCVSMKVEEESQQGHEAHADPTDSRSPFRVSDAAFSAAKDDCERLFLLCDRDGDGEVTLEECADCLSAGSPSGDPKHPSHASPIPRDQLRSVLQLLHRKKSALQLEDFRMLMNKLGLSFV